MNSKMAKIGDTVHFKDTRKKCIPGFVTADDLRVNIQIGENSEGKPIYESREAIEVEVVDNGGRYVRTLLHNTKAAQRMDSFHLPEECETEKTR